MFGQDFHLLLRRTFLIITALFLFSGCSLFEAQEDPVIPVIPTTSSKSATPEGTSPVAIEQFVPKVKATDVLVEIMIDLHQTHLVIVKYGSEQNNLNLEKTFNRSDLEILSDETPAKVRVRIKDAGSITPLFISSAIQTEDEVRSEFSAPQLVSGTIE